MHAIEETKDMLCEELEQISRSENLSISDIEVACKLLKGIKNACEILMFDEYQDGGYSRNYSQRRGYSRADGMNTGGMSNASYNRGNSYARGRNPRTGRYQSYSRADGMEEMKEDILNDVQSLISQTESEKVKQTAMKFIDALENM